MPPDWILSSELLQGFNLRRRAQDWNWKRLLCCLLGKRPLAQEMCSSRTNSCSGLEVLSNELSAAEGESQPHVCRAVWAKGHLSFLTLNELVLVVPPFFFNRLISLADSVCPVFWNHLFVQTFEKFVTLNVLHWNNHCRISITREHVSQQTKDTSCVSLLETL